MSGAPGASQWSSGPQPQGTGRQGAPPRGGAAGGPPLGRQPLRAGRVPGSPEKNAGLPISGRLCLISCLPGRPEPAPLAGPPVPRSQGRRGPPGQGRARARRESRVGAAGRHPPTSPPARLRPPGRAKLLPPHWKIPRPAWNFLQGPLAEAMRGGEGRGTGARPRPEAPGLSTLPGGAVQGGGAGPALPQSCLWR